MGNIPAYKHVYNQLKNQIREGEYSQGDLLPTESELESIFGVSRTTIRRAVGVLSSEGYLQAIQGRGTVVKNPFTIQKLNSITSTTETLRSKGYTVSTQGMVIEVVPASFVVAEALDIKEGTPVYKIQRVQCADGQPISIMKNYFRANVVPGLEQFQDKFVGLYSLIEREYGIILKNATETISAVSATFYEAQILQLKNGAPLLCSKRISTDNQGIPVEYSVTKLIGDKYEYTIVLSGRI